MRFAIAENMPIEDELARRGIHLLGRGTELVGPCPVCGGQDRFAVNRHKRLWNCRGCGRGGDVIDLVQHLDNVEFGAAVRLLAGGDDRPTVTLATADTIEATDASDYERKQHQKAAWLWSRRQPITGTPADRYLREARGITCPFPATLAYLPPSRPGRNQALISAFGLVDELEPGVLGEPLDVDSVHLTLLRPDGTGKVDVMPNKIIIGRPLGRPIVVAPANDLLGIAITEGVEDALSVHQATGLGAWAAGSAGFLPAIAAAVPAYINTVSIIIDDDLAGRRGSLALASALWSRGINTLLQGGVL